MRIRPGKIRRIQKPELLLLIIILVCIPVISYGQFDELLKEAQDFKNDSKSLSIEIIGIIKIIAGTLLGIMALTYIYIRNQQTDLVDKLGKAIIGIAIFFAMLSIGEGIANF
ncbi:MAG TPA: hypothetical protein ENH87_22430 [Pricia antarctica]|uniref:TrbC/VIRB2 family protein n=2 Tax=root TaxID=1 RepID=A0A831QRM3_9FLAO|nr:hypothetical protein [Pricia antarctica]